MDTSKALRALRLFNEKADELEGLSFTKAIFSDQFGVSWHWDRDKGEEVTRFGPEDESIRAFVLTIRFYIQDNEPSSLRRMAALYDELLAESLVSQAVRDEYHHARSEVNKFLDAGPSFNYKFNDKQLTRRDVFQVFLWGGLAHANDEMWDAFSAWRQVPIFFAMMQTEFVRILGTLVDAILYLRRTNDRAVEEIKAAVPSAL